MQEANELWSSAHYRIIVDRVQKLAPLVPDYDFKTTNLEEWKFKSAQKQLHDLVMKLIKPEGA